MWKNRLKVLFFPSWYPERLDDVKGVFFRDQALALSEYGHNVGVVAVNMRSLRTLGLKGGNAAGRTYEADKGMPTYRRRVLAALPRVPYGNYRLWRRAARALLVRYVEEQGLPDLIHAQAALYAGVVAAEWGQENGIPVVLTEHSSGFARGKYERWRTTLAEGAVVDADACIAVSPALREVLEEQLPRTRSRWRWVPNVVADRFCVGEAGRKEGEKPLCFLNLAAMNKNKGQIDLLEAFARAFCNASEVAELWIGGDGPLRGALEVRAQELGIEKRVRFLGQVPPVEVPSLLRQVDAMVVASHYETFGVVAAEALVAGVPVVATRCGGPECIVEGGDGWLVSPGDPDALAAAMLEVATSVDNVDRQAIAERAKARFSGEAVARQITEVYEDVLAQYPETGVTT